MYKFTRNGENICKRKYTLTEVLLLKLSKNTFKFKKPPAITGYSSIVGGKEGDGPIGDCFDAIEEDSYFGQDSWEKAESEMQKRAVKMAIAHSGLVVDDIDFIFSGDLINQCTSSSYGLRDLNIPFLGLYGACSTMAEGLLISSIMVSGGFAKHTVNATSSHFSTAEKQCRFPLSYGGQRTPYAQWTCTASGATVLSAENTAPYVRGGTIGKIVDYGITDANNMGAAMAPVDDIIRP